MNDESKGRDPRIANLDVVHVWNEESGRFEAAHFENISRSGLFIITHNPLQIGSNIRLKFTLVSRIGTGDEIKLRPVDLHAEVIRVIQKEEAGLGIHPGMGIRFIDMPEDIQKAIDEMVNTELEHTTPG